MFRVEGKIVNQQSGEGVADVSVVLYDYDKKSCELGGFIQRLFGDGESRDPESLVPGDRLGSTLTGTDGGFTFSFDADAFARGDASLRPDLVLLVLAPEDARVHNGTICPPQTPLERLIFYTATPISNAGQQESMLIRLPEELLERFDLESSTARQLKTTLTQTANLQARAFAVQKDMATLARTQLTDRMKPAVRRKASTDKAFKGFSLSRFTSEQRAALPYVDHGKPVLAKLNDVADQSLEKIIDLDDAVKRTAVLALTSDQVSDFGLEIDAATGEVSGQVPLGRVVRELQRGFVGAPLERSRSADDIACAELGVDDAFNAAVKKCASAADDSTSDESGANDDDSEEGSSGDTEATVEAQVAKLMAHVTAPEVELSYGVEDSGKVTATITRPSPADVTAYHDFHELQIAFDHVWSEAVDAGLPALLKDIYGEMVDFKWQVSGVEDFPDVTSVTDMQDLYQEYVDLKNLIAAEQAAETSSPLPPAVPPAVLDLLPDMQPEWWGVATSTERATLSGHAETLKNLQAQRGNPFGGFSRQSKANETRTAANALLSTLRSRYNAGVRQSADSPSLGTTAQPTSSSRLERLFKALDERLSEPYRFDLFAPDSVNFGTLLTYRQKWVPGDYQVGSLVSTLPLAPKESRRYTTRRVTKQTRSEKQLTDQTNASTVERSTTSRADSEIVNEARNKTSFEQNSTMNINMGAFGGQFGTRFGVEAEKASSSTKKNFREAVLKAADEFRERRSLEVETTSSVELTTESVGEISNPNDEITVTYLFYELQRQYQISERLHRVTPVVLVANDVPLPHQIDEAWLIAHHWMLHRLLLDDSLRPALDHLVHTLAGNQLTVEALRDNVERQAALVETLTKQVAKKTELAEQAFGELRAMEQMATSADQAQKLKDFGMAMALGPLALLGGGDDGEADDRREEMLKMALDRADNATQEVSAKLTREMSTLQAAIDKYVAALQDHFNHATAIARLRVHVKQNILYYFQGILDHEPSDQRYFRLYNIEVPWIEANELAVSVVGEGARSSGFDSLSKGYRVRFSLPLKGNGTPAYRRTTRRLHEIADLDNLLGYKGNYMIFPARVPSYVHTYMMQDYIDASNGGLRDPDPTQENTLDDLVRYICCLNRHDPDRFKQESEQLRERMRELMTSPRSLSDTVVVPTDSLFIEALPGKHPVMEPFKIVHRALDVKKVQAETRQSELENVRLAARLLEGDRGDPNVDKLVQVTGNADVEVDT